MNVFILIHHFFAPITLKRWTVNLMDWNSGRFESFWIKKNAIEFARKNCDGYLFVDINDECSNRHMSIKNNPEKIKPPPIVISNIETKPQ